MTTASRVSDSREAFEKWIDESGFDLTRGEDRDYAKETTDAAWGGWQAALACQGPVVKVSDLREVVTKMDKVGDMLDEMGSYSYTAVEDIVYSYQLDLGALISKAEKV